MNQVDYASLADIDVGKAKYYADIRGRLVSNDINPTVPAIISDLLLNELDFDGDITAPFDNYEMTYAFGQTEKINSKN